MFIAICFLFIFAFMQMLSSRKNKQTGSGPNCDYRGPAVCCRTGLWIYEYRGIGLLHCKEFLYEICTLYANLKISISDIKMMSHSRNVQHMYLENRRRRLKFSNWVTLTSSGRCFVCVPFQTRTCGYCEANTEPENQPKY